MSFLKTIWHLIANFFSGLSKEMQTVIIPLAVALGNALKDFLALDSADIIGEIAKQFGVAGGADLEEKIKAAIPITLQKLDLAQQFLHLNDPNAIIAAVLGKVKYFTDDQKTLFWTTWVTLINHVFADGKITVLESFQVVAYYYKNKPTPTPATIAQSVMELTAQPDGGGGVVYAPEAAIAALAAIAPVATIPESADATGESVAAAIPESVGTSAPAFEMHQWER